MFWSDVFNSSQLWIVSQFSKVVLIEFSIAEFHHEWCTLKSPQIIVLCDNWIAVKHLSMVHWSLLICCDFSLYMFSNSILEISFAEMLSICKSEFFDKSDLDVHTRSCLVLKTKIMILSLISRFDGTIKLVKKNVKWLFCCLLQFMILVWELYLQFW
jgi:hypothetical protein